MIVPKVLLERGAQGKCIAYVGAGFSTPFGMPLWYDLMKRLLCAARNSVSDAKESELIVEAKKLTELGEYDEAAEVISSLLTKADFNIAIGNSFDSEVLFNPVSETTKERLERRAKHLVLAGWFGIVTTNYDLLIEYAIRKHAVSTYKIYEPTDSNFGLAISESHEKKRFFAKLHGSIDGGNYVLGKEEYTNTYVSDGRVRIFMESIMLQANLVFIGSSVEKSILEIRKKSF